MTALHDDSPNTPQQDAAMEGTLYAAPDPLAPAPTAFAGVAPASSGPPIDMSVPTGTVTPGDSLFDDQPLQQYPAPPRPPSEEFYRLDRRLQALGTKIIYIGVPGSSYSPGSAGIDRAWWDLWGPQAGKQGLELAPNVSGLMHTPFQHLMSEGPYMIGAVPQRVDWRKRELGFGVLVNVGPKFDTNTFRYRMLEERWWRSWSAREDGYWGVYTRTHGWRWLRVRLAEDPKTPFQYDPTGEGIEGFMQWDMVAVAPQPYYHSRKRVVRWDNVGEGNADPPGMRWDLVRNFINLVNAGLVPGVRELRPGVDVGEGILHVLNRGTEPSWPIYLVSSPGLCWIEDGPGGDMVELPLLTPEDGVVMIDTDPLKRTATSAVDPVDPVMYRILRNTQLLDFILHDVTTSTLPVWRRMTTRFQVPWPARSPCSIRVRHSNPGASVTVLMPQRFGMGYA